MKKNLFGLLIILLVIVAGCRKEEEEPITMPQGKFTGKFTRLHLNKTNNKIDTLSSNFVITLSESTGFAVLSDTTVIHAGSKGSFIIDPYYIQFSDSTIPAGPVPTKGKIHLAGVYDYYYQGSVLKFGRANDTLSYSYDLILTP
jgi:hypothetical protein